MKNIIKTTIATMILIMVLGIAVFAQNKDNFEIITKSNENYQVEQGEKIIVFNNDYVVLDSKNHIIDVYIESNEKDFKIADTYTTKSNNTVIEFNDKSFAVINESKDTFEFTPSECGDWEIKVKDRSELIKVIKTYMQNKYNMNDNTIDNSTIFKDNNIIGY